MQTEMALVSRISPYDLKDLTHLLALEQLAQRPTILKKKKGQNKMKTGIFTINQIARNSRLDKVHGMWTKAMSEIRLLVYNSWEEDHGSKFLY